MRRTLITQRGLSLVELMVAMTLGLMLVLVAIGVLLSTNRGFEAVDHGTAARDKERLAKELLTSVILQAGFEDWGNPVVSDSDTSGRRTAIYRQTPITQGGKGLDVGAGGTNTLTFTQQVGRMSWRQVHNHQHVAP